jgi:predicted DNA-binding antitoxin AbrB/MazE fold protein
MYENGIMKPVKIVFKRGKGMIRVIEGVNLIKVHYVQVWKYHNETPFVKLIYANKKAN